jgi:DNA-binding transcriptional regulator YiaG
MRDHMIGHQVSQMISRSTMENQNTPLELNPKAIKTLRQALRLSQQELASVLGVGVATVSRWERGTLPSGTAALILRMLISEPWGMKETSDVKVKSPIERHDHVLLPNSELYDTEFKWLTDHLIHISNKKMTYPNHS